MHRLESYLHGQWEKSYDPRALVQMKADTINAAPGDLQGYDCRQCRNRGYIAFVGEEGNLLSRECGCMSIRRCLGEIGRSGLKQVLQSKTFDSFQPLEDWQKRMLAVCRRYADGPKGWLLLSGQSGCGKTHLCAAVCNTLLMAGRQVRYMSWRESIVQLKGLAGDYDRQQLLLDGFKTAQVLYIDDLFKCGGSPTPADISLAFELLNYRYNNGLHTVISTERTPQQLVALDEATGSRIIEMAEGNLLVIPESTAKNYRLRHIRQD